LNIIRNKQASINTHRREQKSRKTFKEVFPETLKLDSNKFLKRRIWGKAIKRLLKTQHVTDLREIDEYRTLEGLKIAEKALG